MRYPAKILLLGEYTVVNASHALARPFRRFSGAWAQGAGEDPVLRTFLEFLQERPATSGLRLDLDALDADIGSGLRFASDIRPGYGLGSSGALCAAVYDRYALDKIVPEDRGQYHRLKRQLAEIEHFFHGSSSGADPLVSYLDQPLLLLHSGNAEPAVLPDPEPPFSFFLLDTGQERETGPLVAYFLDRCREPAYGNAVLSRLAPANNSAIQAWLAGDMAALYQRWQEISALQYQYMLRMIPEAIRELWSDSLHNDAFALKLCGAGGGGYLLGMCNDWHLVSRQLRPWTLLPIA